MPNLSAGDFVNKVASDAAFRSQVGITTDMPLSEFQSKAAAAGFNFTPEEILAAIGSQQEEALSDESLDEVGGGYAGAGTAGNNPLNKPIISVKNMSIYM